jgi:hypothetical protein
MVNLEEFTHEYLGIYEHNKKYLRVLLKDDNCKKWKTILDDTMETIMHDGTMYYLLNKKEYNEFLDLIKSVDKKDNKKVDDENEDITDTSESSDTDDELIQKTLTRRLTSQSKGYEIDDDHVSDSEMEDVISLGRRFRAVYKVIKNLAKRLEKIESNLKI